MSKNIRTAGDTVKVVASAAVSSGDYVVFATTVTGNDALSGIAEQDAAAGEAFVLVRNFVADLPKENAAFAVGDRLYWDSSNSRLTKTAGSNALVGWCSEARAAGTTTGRVVSKV